MAIAALLATLVTPGADAQEPVVERLGGADRYETAALVAQALNDDQCNEPCSDEYKGQQAASYTLVRGDSFADALSAANTGIRPILLTPQGSVPNSVIDYLAPWPGNHFAIVVGDRSVVSDRVIDDLRARFLADDVRRDAGRDRYATNVRSATETWQVCADRGAIHLPEVVVATGQDWPDGIAAAGFNGQDYCKLVLLTAPDRLPEVVRNFIIDQAQPGPRRPVGPTTAVTILGGPSAISPAVEAEIRSLDVGPVQRLSGPDRQGTALAVAEEFYARGCRSSDAQGPDDENYRCGVTIVRPDSYADAIAAPTLTNRRGSPVLVARSRDDLGPDNEAFLARHRDEIEIVTILGSPDVVSERVAQQAEAALR